MQMKVRALCEPGHETLPSRPPDRKASPRRSSATRMRLTSSQLIADGAGAMSPESAIVDGVDTVAVVTNRNAMPSSPRLAGSD